MPILIKLVVDLLCGVLNALGGFHFLWMRRYIMPILIGAVAAVITHIWWVAFLTLPAIGTLSIGYGKDGNFGRAVWIGLQCFTLGLGLFLTHHLAWYFYVPYVILGCVFGGSYRNWQQLIGDDIAGAWMGLILICVH